MAAFNKIVTNPTNSGDDEARKLLGAHVNSGIKSDGPRTSPGSTTTKARYQNTGSSVSGGARISGGRG